MFLIVMLKKYCLDLPGTRQSLLTDHIGWLICSYVKSRLNQYEDYKMHLVPACCFVSKHAAFRNKTKNHDLNHRYRMSVSQMTTDMFRLSYWHTTVLFSFMTFHRVCNKSNTTGVTSGAGMAYPTRSTWFCFARYKDKWGVT